MGLQCCLWIQHKVYRLETRVGLKGIKYGTKNTIEDMAFGDGGVSGSI